MLSNEYEASALKIVVLTCDSIRVSGHSVKTSQHHT